MILQQTTSTFKQWLIVPCGSWTLQEIAEAMENGICSICECQDRSWCLKLPDCGGVLTVVVADLILQPEPNAIATVGVIE